MFKIKFKRIIGVMIIISLALISMGLMFGSRQGYALMLEGKKVIETKMLRRKIPVLEKNINAKYQEIGKRTAETVLKINSDFNQISIDDNLKYLFVQLKDSLGNLHEMKKRLAALPGLMDKQIAFHQAVINLNDKDIFVKQEAIRLLEEIGDKDALPYLVEMLNDPEVGSAAASAMLELINSESKYFKNPTARYGYIDGAQEKKICLKE